MRLPVDTSTVNFVAAGPPEPALDFSTKAQKTDADGRPVFTVHLFAVAADASTLAITRWAGHSSSAFVLDRYGHLLDGPAATATARLDQMARGATG